MTELFLGDCRDIIQTQLLSRSRKPDLVITSPPYDKLRNYNNSLEWGEEIYKGIFSTLYLVLNNGGIVVWVVNDSTINGSESLTSFKQAINAVSVGFKLHDTMIYKKNSPAFPARKNGNRYTQIFEYMFVFSKGKPKTANLICDKKNKWAGYKDFSKKLKNPVPNYSPRNNIWEYTTSFNKKTGHPAPFPEKLAEDHIKSWSNEGDLVLDPMMGSGTVGRVCQKLNRDFIGIEKVKDYIDIAKKDL